MRYELLSIICTITILSLAYAQSAEAAPKTYVSIIRSDVCEKSNCIGIKDLIIHDNSTQKISGKFVFKSKLGDYAREKGFKNSLNWYATQPDKLVVFVNPDSYTLVRSKVITIVPSLGEYAGAGQHVKESIDSQTDKRTTKIGVFVDAKCQNAKIGIKQYTNITDIITHMATGCTTPLDNTVEHITEKTKVEHCGNDCQHKKFMEAAKKLAKENQLRKK